MEFTEIIQLPPLNFHHHHGRFTLVKKLRLDFNDIPSATDTYNTPAPHREDISKAWEPFFEADSYQNTSKDSFFEIRFPALEVLVLDFTRLDLANRALTVSHCPPFPLQAPHELTLK